jgi:hypothetical protein
LVLRIPPTAQSVSGYGYCVGIIDPIRFYDWSGHQLLLRLT